MHDNVYVSETKNKGQGLFAKRPFNKNEVILRFDGEKVSKEKAYSIDPNYSANLLQIGEELYIDIINTYSFFTNHSCSPNAIIKVAINTAFLLASQPIKQDEEINFDYSSTETSPIDIWKMNCNCSNYSCRKIISGFGELSNEQKQKLLNIGAVPDYVKKSFPLK